MIEKTQLMQDIKNCTYDGPDMVVNCSNCPHYKRGFPTRCRDYLLKEAFALLKEQESELLQQEAELDILRSVYKQENPHKQETKLD